MVEDSNDIGGYKSEQEGLDLRKNKAREEPPPAYLKTETSSSENQNPTDITPKLDTLSVPPPYDSSNGIANAIRNSVSARFCLAQKSGPASIKVEYTKTGINLFGRRWKEVEMEIQDTILNIYELKSYTPFVRHKTLAGYYASSSSFYENTKPEYTLVRTISLVNLKIDTDFSHYRPGSVFRITSKEGIQILIEVQTDVSVSSWVTKLTEGSKIAKSS